MPAGRQAGKLYERYNYLLSFVLIGVRELTPLGSFSFVNAVLV